jgi:hypothetical protein
MKNRELKFRVWSHLSKSLEYFDIYQGANLGIAGGVSEPQQFTGLKDKNGMEVYEGDLINFSVNNTVELGDKDIMDYKNQEVYYDERLAGFYFGKDGFQILDKIIVQTIEVVGNVNAN